MLLHIFPHVVLLKFMQQNALKHRSICHDVFMPLLLVADEVRPITMVYSLTLINYKMNGVAGLKRGWSSLTSMWMPRSQSGKGKNSGSGEEMSGNAQEEAHDCLPESQVPN
jgi:hypothetical protein